MALTPEDVVNKRFQPTKFREGYDQDEVDDFLDEVVVELRRLNQENEELRQRLIASDSRINELQRSQGSSAAQSAPAESFTQPEPAVQAEAPAAPQFAAQPAAASYAAPDTSVDPNNTNNLLQLARRLHEEHVREGVEKRDALIAEGHEEATRVVQEAEVAQRAAAAEAEAAQRTAAAEAEAAQRAAAAEAEAAQRAQLATIEQVEELRNFERDYRQKLKSYIEGQLRELDSTNAIGNQTGSSAYAAPSGQSNANYTGFAGTN
jgi:DivIVA domain-containing protein